MNVKKASPYLRQPSEELQAAFLRFIEAFEAAHEPAHPLDKLARRNYPLYLETVRENEQGLGLPDGFVPSSVYWLVDANGEIVGVSSLRHRLTPALEDLGGHIGYRVHPAHRRKGYGTLLLKLTLEQARRRGLRRVLVTCDTDNIGSAGVIRNNGGVLDSQGISSQSGKHVSRFWIDLPHEDETQPRTEV